MTKVEYIFYENLTWNSFIAHLLLGKPVTKPEALNCEMEPAFYLKYINLDSSKLIRSAASITGKFASWWKYWPNFQNSLKKCKNLVY